MKSATVFLRRGTIGRIVRGVSMGAFNIVEAELACPRCGRMVHAHVQFKFGDLWQHRYALNDRLHWGGNDRGRPGLSKVVADGYVETACPTCGFGGEWDAYVHLTHDRIVDVRTADGTYDFSGLPEAFLIVEE